MRKNYAPKKSNIEKSSLFLFFLFLLQFPALHAQTTYTFTSAGATASLGPTQLQVTNAYFGTSLAGQVVSTNGIQSWTVPTSGNYRISALGSQGGGADGGKGALIEGDFALTAGDVLRIVVGQQGITLPAEPNSCGGGGGTYVMKGPGNTVADIAVIAGGGGGSPASYTISRHASVGTSGNWGAGASNTDGAPGTNGNGGNKGIAVNNQDRAAGGGGFFTDGQSTAQPSFIGAANGGSAFVNGSSGGTHNTTGVPGGFGGGGAVWTTGHKGGGGGGGYSGGGGGQTNGANVNTHSGGGGGSYNNGTNQVNVISTFTGDGRVVITELCNISLTASTANSLNPAICTGQSLTLTTNAVSNYVWSNGNTTTNSIVVAPTTTTVYTLSATSVSNCTTARSITVTVSGGLPTLSVVSSTNQTCLGKTATLTASGALTYTWTGGVTNGVSFYPSTTTTYTVTGENGCGTTTAVSTISVAPLAMTAVSSATAVCTNKTATLTVTVAATSYTWQPGNITGGSSILIVSPSVTTIYTITASDGTCSGVANIPLQADPVPTITSSSSSSIVCPGGSVNLTASGGINYTWTPVSMSGSNITVSPTITTLYTVIGDNSFGCLSNSNQVVTVGSQPTLVLTASNSTICNGSTATLTASGANIYAWTGGPATSVYTVNPTQTTVYTAVGTDTNSLCTDTKTIAVDVVVSVLTITGNTTICSGGSANLTAGGATTYTWSENNTPFAGINLSPLVNTTYTVNATNSVNNINCPVSATVEVIVNPNPTVTAVGTRTAMCAKETNTLTASGANTYTWTTSTGTVAGSSIEITSQFATVAFYTVTGTNSQGCETSIEIPFNISACTGINQLARGSQQLVVYPNPNNGEFTIETGTDMTLNLINELGQLIKQIQLNEVNNYKTSVSHLSNGIYFIVGENVRQKIIVNK